MHVMLTWLPPTPRQSTAGADLFPPNTTPSSSPSTYSGLMDHYSLTSSPQSRLSHRYVAGVLREGEYIVCPDTHTCDRSSCEHQVSSISVRCKGLCSYVPVWPTWTRPQQAGSRQMQPLTLQPLTEKPLRVKGKRLNRLLSNLLAETLEGGQDSSQLPSC